MAHNLRTSLPWIPVVYLDGTRQDVTADVLFTDAHLIQRLSGTGVEQAALLRLCAAVSALIVRAEPSADVERWAHRGFPSRAVRVALDAIDWELGAFMQVPGIEATDAPASSLTIGAPQASSKSWFTRPATPLTVAEVARTLVGAWFYEPGLAGRSLGKHPEHDTPLRPRGAVSFSNHGLRSFWQGANLAHTLLANCSPAWVRGKALPLFAGPALVRPSAGALTAATWTGTCYLLSDDLTTVRRCGRPIPGVTDTYRDVEKTLWLSDMSVMRYTLANTAEKKVARAMSPQVTSLEYACDWLLASERRSAVEVPPGLVDARMSRVFALSLCGRPAAPEVEHYGWLSSSVLNDTSVRRNLASVVAHDVAPIRKRLWVACSILFPDYVREMHEQVFARFASTTDSILRDVLHRDRVPADTGERLREAATQALYATISPFVLSPGMSERMGEVHRVMGR